MKLLVSGIKEVISLDTVSTNDSVAYPFNEEATRKFPDTSAKAVVSSLALI